MTEEPRPITRPIILIVDDERIVRRATMRALEASLEGVTIQAAESAQAGLDFLIHFFVLDPHGRVFILSDNNMLEMAKPDDAVKSGEELLREARRRFGNDVFTHIVSGHDLPDAPYIDARLMKPFSGTQIVEAFHRFEKGMEQSHP